MAVEFVDTHCHIQFADYEMDEQEAIQNALDSGVTKMIAVGCTLADSELAVQLAGRSGRVWAAIGVHPHEAKDYVEDDDALQKLRHLAGESRVVAVGEIGLDYFYGHSEKADQIKMLRFQLSLAQEYDLPVIFHVRGSKESGGNDVWEDFWAILEEFKPRGVIHSFSAGVAELEQILSHGLSVGLNGIMTFTKDAEQLRAAQQVPLQKIVVETDAPFLTPTPFRGRMCEPKHVATTAAFLSELRGEDLTEFARVTTQNADRLFKLV